MKIGILTPDSVRPNLAAMQISAYHKSIGDEILFNFPLIVGDFTYASIMYKWTPDPVADLVGGPKYPATRLDPEIELMRPDYSLYPGIDYSIGYTYRPCPRTCSFCIVPQQNNPERHHSIYDFHDTRFNKICLLNNNTLSDPSWRETFDEIIDAGLIIKDEGGYDARLITDESAHYLSRLRFEKGIHLAWDFIDHEHDVLTGICKLKQAMPSMFNGKRVSTYVLIGNGHSTHEENMHRVMLLEAMKAEPYVMKMQRDDPYQAAFARWVNMKAIFKTVSWQDYSGRVDP